MLEQPKGRRDGPADAGGDFVLALAVPAHQRESRRQAQAYRVIAIVHETPFSFHVKDGEGIRLGLSHHCSSAPPTVEAVAS